MCGLFSLVAARGSYSLVAVHRFLTAVASVAEHRLNGTQVQYLQLPGSTADSVVVAHRLKCPEALGSSRTRDQTHVSCIGRRSPYH